MDSKSSNINPKKNTVNAYEAFLKDNIDLKPLLDSRQKTANVKKH